MNPHSLASSIIQYVRFGFVSRRGPMANWPKQSNASRRCRLRRHRTWQATRIKELSGAQIAAHGGTARWGLEYHARTEEERQFTLALMAAHGVPDELIAAAEPFYEYIAHEGTAFTTDRT